MWICEYIFLCFLVINHKFYISLLTDNLLGPPFTRSVKVCNSMLVLRKRVALLIYSCENIYLSNNLPWGSMYLIIARDLNRRSNAE